MLAVLPMRHRRHAGISVIEIVVTMAILGFAFMVAIPNFTTWIYNTKIRTAAESISYGLMLARTEAIRRNSAVRFTLESATSSGWTIAVDSDNTVIQQRYAAEGANGVVLQTTPSNATTVTYTAIGWTRTNTDGSDTLSQITVDSSKLSAADSRELNVVLNAGGGSRLCDPHVSGSDPRAC